MPHAPGTQLALTLTLTLPLTLALTLGGARAALHGLGGGGESPRRPSGGQPAPRVQHVLGRRGATARAARVAEN